MKKRELSYTALTPNQVVAFNLTKARESLGWSQAEAGAALEKFLGTKWSKATFSAAERSIDGKRVKTFSADEIVAFARCFGFPVWFFFEPPDRHVQGQPVRMKCSAFEGETTGPEEFKHIVRSGLRDKDDVKKLLSAIAYNLSAKARNPQWDFANVESSISEELEHMRGALRESSLSVVFDESGFRGLEVPRHSQANKSGETTGEHRRKRSRKR